MDLTRRELLLLTGGLAAGCARPPSEPARPERRRRRAQAPIEAIAVDAFVLFDPRPFARALDAAFPGHGAQLAAEFRTRLFGYGWLRALGGRYRDFWRLSEDALGAAAEALGLALTDATRAALLEQWAALPPWPDAAAGVRELQRAGYPLAVLSNWSPRMLETALARSGLDDAVRPLSTDLVQSYKPDPAAYAIALDAFGLDRARVGFVAFAGWDAAGGSWFGFPTVWMNRMGAPAEPLDMAEVTLATSFARGALLDALGLRA
ncbi:haloacid dehalogenase type II [Haliangium sp.]|uniref:haloacid dehalogenase type II n=1 Tax=Haliangium sp. TaxID=2663208 RepID=UPI003D0C4222